MEVCLTLVEHGQHLTRKLLAAFAALGEYLGQGNADAALCAVLSDELHLLGGIGREGVDGDNDRHAELLHVVQMGVEVADAALERAHVGGVQLGLGYAAVVLERADGRDEHDAVRRDAGLAALDVHELLCAEVRAEAGLGDGDVSELHGETGRLNAVAAVRDVRERAAVHERRGALERLNEVRLDGVAHQRGHRALSVQVARIDRLAGKGVRDENVAEALLEVVEILRQTQDGHDLGRNRDHEVILARHTVYLAAQTDRDVAQRAVVHIHDTGENDAARIDAEHIALLHVVVEHGAEQIVRRGDRVHVAGEVQIDVLHRNDLRVAAACRAALDAEYRAERRLAQRDHGLFAHFCERLAQTDGRGGLALAGRSRVNGGDENELAVRLVCGLFPYVCGQLGLVPAVQLKILGVQTGCRCYLGDRAHLAALCDFDVG